MNLLHSFARRRLYWSLAGSVSLGFFGSQSPRESPRSEPLATRDTVPLATITTDTGAFAPFNKNFARFTAPGMCIGVAKVALGEARRSMADQIAHIFEDSALTGDSLPTGIVSLAGACAVHFAAARVAVEDLPDLFTLYLMAGQDSLAQTVIERRLALAPNATTRAAVLKSAINGYLTAEPIRLTAAEATVTRMDALGTNMMVERLNAHASLLYLAESKFDKPRMQREAERIIALGHEVPPSGIGSVSVGIIQRAYTALTEMTGTEDSVTAIAARAKKDLSRFPIRGGVNFQVASVATVRHAIVDSHVRSELAGKILPVVNAAFWIPRKPDSWPPGKGKASLILYGGPLASRCLRNDGNILGPSLRLSECGLLYTYLPKWTKLYGDRLAITIVSSSAGYAMRSLVLSPAAEADTLAWFLRDYLKLPVTVGLVLDSLRVLPAPDGRRLRRDTSFYGNVLGKDHLNYDPNWVVLFYDAHGTCLFAENDIDLPVFRRILTGAMGVVPAVTNQSEKP